jgi:penicillin G amidase
VRRPTSLILAALTLLPAYAQQVAGLKQPVEILRDKWGVPHIYAKNTADLFFAQGWITAKDRLFQIDLWRRVGTGKLAEVLGPSAIARDRIARLVRYRGNWDDEWKSYSPEAKLIATAFTNGINAYIRSLGGKRTMEFEAAGYDPGFWVPEDVTARVAGLLMTRNANTEVSRTLDVMRFGIEKVQQIQPPDPFIKLALPKGLDPATITAEILRDYTAAVGAVRFPGEQGSNNWVVDGSLTASGKPLLANDPHRPIQLPSLRKTVHLVAPGWNVIGAGEPALPGVALGHNENVAFGFTIVGIDQQDLFVEKLNPANPNEYLYKGAHRAFEIEQQKVAVKGWTGPETITLKYSVHGPVLHEANGYAYALKWAGLEPGGAGYLPALRLAQAKNWKEFLDGVRYYKIPSENLVYADRQGNIGWVASGLSPIRKNGATGLFPVPGDTDAYEWSGYLPLEKHPQAYNPAKHYIATANHKILPEGYTEQLSYEWAAPFRFQRVDEMLRDQKKKFTVTDFERMQYDVLSLPARRLQAIIRPWRPMRHNALVADFLQWDCRVTADSKVALLFELWMSRLPGAVFGRDFAARAINPEVLFKELEKAQPFPAKALADSLEAAVRDLDRVIPDANKRMWGTLHQIQLRHPLNMARFDLPAVPRPGDANTVLAQSGANFRTTNGASYRQVIDLSDWDSSTMTNVPGESGDPGSKYYANLMDDWAKGRFHPMVYSRKAVEAATDERFLLTPAAAP